MRRALYIGASLALSLPMAGAASAQMPPPPPQKAAVTTTTTATTTTATEAVPVFHHHRRRRPTVAMRVVRRATLKATAEPTAGAYLNAALIYDYEPGKLYTLHTSPRFLTAIALRPGEKLISKAAGDTVRWVFAETTEGAASQVQTIVLIKPVEGGVRTNLVLTTDQRTYLLEAVSHDEPYYTSLISWNYPQDAFKDLQLAKATATVQALAATALRTNAVVSDSLSIDRLHFDYRITALGRHAPRWQPIRVFDDGLKTYVQFPTDLASTDAPPLFMIGPHDAAQLVNYHYINGYYVVDRLLNEAELRIGEKPQDIVRITYVGRAR